MPGRSATGLHDTIGSLGSLATSGHAFEFVSCGAARGITRVAQMEQPLTQFLVGGLGSGWAWQVGSGAPLNTIMNGTCEVPIPPASAYGAAGKCDCQIDWGSYLRVPLPGGERAHCKAVADTMTSARAARMTRLRRAGLSFEIHCSNYQTIRSFPLAALPPGAASGGVTGKVGTLIDLGFLDEFAATPRFDVRRDSAAREGVRTRGGWAGMARRRTTVSARRPCACTSRSFTSPSPTWSRCFWPSSVASRRCYGRLWASSARYVPCLRR